MTSQRKRELVLGILKLGIGAKIMISTKPLKNANKVIQPPYTSMLKRWTSQ